MTPLPGLRRDEQQHAHDRNDTGHAGHVSHASVSGRPSRLDSAALAHDALRYQHDTGSSPTQTRASYVSFTIDAAGNRRHVQNAPTCVTPTATGT